MSDDFKKKVKNYIDGKLSGEEKEKMKVEIEKLDKYQEVLDECVGEDKNPIYKGEKKIIKISKRKAKIENVKTVLAILALIVAFVMVANIVTAYYYNSKDSERLQSYRSVIATAVATTQPNISVGGGSSSTGNFFTSEIDLILKKFIGSERVEVGDLKINFAFSKAEVERTKLLNGNFQESLFCHPEDGTKVEVLDDVVILEKLPEGTVAEAFISLDKLYEVDEILGKLENKELKPIWFAVDIGCEKEDFINNLIGFPYQTLWNETYWALDSRTEEEISEKGMWNSKVVTETRSSPGIESYGDGEIRSENFMKNLKYLQEYEEIANEVTPFGYLDLDNKIIYLTKNGVRIYGLAITGPSKEILKLKEEEWVTNIKVGEVRFWNWK
jgi:hypothetical protein